MREEKKGRQNQKQKISFEQILLIINTKDIGKLIKQNTSIIRREKGRSMSVLVLQRVCSLSMELK